MKLIWLDLETTGLIASRDEILEIAVAEADFYVPFNARHIYQRVLHFPRGRQRHLDPFILDMHTKNGLLEECADLDGSHRGLVAEVEDELLALIPEIEDKNERPILAGSTISFDLSFLKVWMPTLASRFSHRLYDVSGLKLFCQSMGMEKFKKAEAHRAKADVDESIAHGRACAQWLSARDLGFI